MGIKIKMGFVKKKNRLYVMIEVEKRRYCDNLIICKFIKLYIY